MLNFHFLCQSIFIFLSVLCDQPTCLMYVRVVFFLFFFFVYLLICLYICIFSSQTRKVWCTHAQWSGLEALNISTHCIHCIQWIWAAFSPFHKCLCSRTVDTSCLPSFSSALTNHGMSAEAEASSETAAGQLRDFMIVAWKDAVLHFTNTFHIFHTLFS